MQLVQVTYIAGFLFLSSPLFHIPLAPIETPITWPHRVTASLHLTPQDVTSSNKLTLEVHCLHQSDKIVR